MKPERQQDLKAGDRIHCRNWKDLQTTALSLSAEGYGVAVIGFQDMSDDVLTITEVPETKEDEQLEGQMSIEEWDYENRN